MDMQTSHDIHSPEWLTFGELLQRPWFSRLWVVQDVVLAKVDVVCGTVHPLVKVGTYNTLSRTVEIEILSFPPGLAAWRHKNPTNFHIARLNSRSVITNV